MKSDHWRISGGPPQDRPLKDLHREDRSLEDPSGSFVRRSLEGLPQEERPLEDLHREERSPEDPSFERRSLEGLPQKERPLCLEDLHREERSLEDPSFERRSLTNWSGGALILILQPPYNSNIYFSLPSHDQQSINVSLDIRAIGFCIRG